MTTDTLDITIYFRDEDDRLIRLIRELDELDVAYDECRIADAPSEVVEQLARAGGGEPASPSVSINGEILPAPTTANIMSAIMHAKSGGFYQ